MAKPTPVEGLDFNTPVAEAAQRMLAARLGDLLKFAPGVHDDDADAVHDMRVASRRLRAALSVLDSKVRFYEARLEVKRLADALGHVRDVDVTAAWLEKALQTLPDGSPARAGVQRLADERRQARHDPDQQLVRALERFTGEVAPRLAGQFAQAKGKGRLGGHRLRNAFSRQLKRLRVSQDATLASSDPETAHELRIRAKKLKYRAEVLEPALAGVVDVLLERLSTLQELLGDLHDADVRRPLLERFLVMAAPDERPGALELLQRTLLDRERLAGELVTELHAWHDEGLLDNLRARLE
jgi:CHAD domain-containing protein